jgi:putative transposase
MPRTARAVVPGGIYHVLNRGNARQDLFHKPADFDAFLRVLNEGLKQYPVDLLAYCLMNNHWHLVLRPRLGEPPATLGRLLGWICVTHVRRHHKHYEARGGGHLYQGRFKSFPVQDDPHLHALCRYVESNPFRARMVERAELWPYSSLRWTAGIVGNGESPPVSLAPWPVDVPADWLAWVNEPLPADELARLRISVQRGRPFGEDDWVGRTAKALGLMHTLRAAGRPPKPTAVAEWLIENQ